MLVLPGSPLTYDGKRIYGFPQTHDPNGTCYFGPPVKPKIEAEHRGSCVIFTFPTARIVRHDEPHPLAVADCAMRRGCRRTISPTKRK